MCPSIHDVMWLQYENAPPRYSPELCKWLSENFPGCWISCGCEAPVSWPACSLDTFRISFLLWRYVKAKVHASRAANEELWCRIKQFSNEIKNTPRIFECLWVAVLLRAELCVCKHRSHFEYLLHESQIKKVINNSYVYFLCIQNSWNLGSI